MEYIVNKREDWDVLAREMIGMLEHKVLLLKGDLGAGKTTFTQSLLRQLGSKDEVDSPTYALVNEYDTPKGKVFHFDLYRIKGVEELYDMGMEEYLEGGYLSIIEWPEIYEEELEGMEYHCIRIEIDEKNRKRVKID